MAGRLPQIAVLAGFVVSTAAGCGIDEIDLDEGALGKADGVFNLDLDDDGTLRRSCRVKVEGRWLEMEDYYLPRVVTAENGDGPDEALKAVAIAARSYAYFVLTEKLRNKTLRDRGLTDGDDDQLMGTRANSAARAAVEATRNKVLVYQGKLVTGFHMLGAWPDDDDDDMPCRGSGSGRGTEKRVTYNWQLADDEVKKTSAGMPYETNRGCLSHRGANCLAAGDWDEDLWGDEGWDHEEILRYYYGADIEIGEVACTDGRESSDDPQSRSNEWVDEQDGRTSATCKDCVLGDNDCVLEYGEFKCMKRSDSCNWDKGHTARQRHCTDWEFCLKSGRWSGGTASAEGTFACVPEDGNPDEPDDGDGPDDDPDPDALYSANCNNCDLNKRDCVWLDRRFQCLAKSKYCESDGGNSFRQFDCDKWEYCYRGRWSGNPERAPSSWHLACE